MAAITYGVSAPVAEAPAKRKSIWLRIFDAIVEARMRQVQREMAAYRHLMPLELELAGDKITGKNESSLPFVR